MVSFTLDGKELIKKTVKSAGSSSIIYLPKSWTGKTVAVVLEGEWMNYRQSFPQLSLDNYKLYHSIFTSPEHYDHYTNPVWIKIKKRVYERDNYSCQVCKKPNLTGKDRIMWWS